MFSFFFNKSLTLVYGVLFLLGLFLTFYFASMWFYTCMAFPALIGCFLCVFDIS